MNKAKKFAFLNIFILILFGVVGGVVSGEARDDATLGELLKRSKRRTQVPKANIPSRTNKKIDIKSIKPPKTRSLFYSSDVDMARLEEITDEGIKEIFALVKKFQKSRNRGELWLRLAELYNEKAKLIEFRLQDVYERKMKQFRSKKSNRRPRLDLSASKEYYRKAIRLYKLYLKDYRKGGKTDLVLYYLGTNYFQIGELQEGTKYYDILSRKFPRSPYVSDANFYLGDFHFDNERWTKALHYFNKVLKKKRGRFYFYALYKSTWCIFRKGEVKRAIARMKKLIFYKETRKSVQKLRLDKEALKDLLIFYSESSDYKEAVYFFKNKVKKNQDKYLEKLAYLYVNKGDRAAFLNIFKMLISEYPNNPDAFDYQYQIVLGYSYASKSRRYRQELFNLVDNYSQGGDWYRANKRDEKLIKKSKKITEEALRGYVLRQHQTAQNDQTVFSKRLAEQGYKKYFKYFGNSNYAVEMRFFFGELLYDYKRYANAASQYKYVISSPGPNKYKRRAAENYIFALEKNLPSDQSLQKQSGKTTQKISLPVSVLRFEEGAKWFLQKFPTDRNRPNIMFRLARIYYFHNHFDKALVLFEEIVDKYPKTRYAEYSTNLILDSYNLRKDYKGLEMAGKRLLKKKGLGQPAIRRQIQDVVQKTEFKRAQDMQTEKKYLKSAQMFSKFANFHKNSPLAISARFNAGVNYVRVGALLKGAKSFRQILNFKPTPSNQRLKRQAKVQLALLYSDLGNYKKAAEVFEQLGKDFESLSPAKSRDYYYNAAFIWDGFLYWTRALKMYDAYLSLAKNTEKPEVYYLKAEIYRKRKSWKQAIRNYEQSIRSGLANKEKLIEIQYQLSQCYKKIRQERNSLKWLNTASNMLKNNRALGSGIVWGVRARLEIVIQKLEKLRSIRIPRGPKQQRIVQKKLNLLDQINGELQKIVALDHPMGIVGALSISGAAHRYMADAFRTAPSPKGLNAAENKLYRQQINQKLVTPQLDKAIASYQSAVAKGKELDEFSDWYQAALRVLQQLTKQKKQETFQPKSFVVKDTLGL